MAHLAVIGRPSGKCKSLALPNYPCFKLQIRIFFSIRVRKKKKNNKERERMQLCYVIIEFTFQSHLINIYTKQIKLLKYLLLTIRK